jgi:hypothetical protein
VRENLQADLGFIPEVPRSKAAKAITLRHRNFLVSHPKLLLISISSNIFNSPEMSYFQHFCFFWLRSETAESLNTGYRLDNRGSVPGRSDFFFSASSRLALGTTQCPIQWVPGLFYRGKVVGVWSWLTPPSSVKIKMSGTLALAVSHWGLVFESPHWHCLDWGSSWNASVPADKCRKLPLPSTSLPVHHLQSMSHSILYNLYNW